VCGCANLRCRPYSAGVLTINVPVVYMGRYEVMELRVMDSPPSKPLCTAPYKQQVH
jgi:hypothetical protein